MSTPDISRSSYMRSPSPVSMASVDMSPSVDTKLRDMESLLSQQKSTINQQKDDIAAQKKKIRRLEMAVQHLYREDYNLEDID